MYFQERNVRRIVNITVYMKETTSFVDADLGTDLMMEQDASVSTSYYTTVHFVSITKQIFYS